MRWRTAGVAILSVVIGLLWNHRSRKQTEDYFRLAELLCLTNGLQPLYADLRENRLGLEALEKLVNQCSGQTVLPALVPDGRFLSSFFVRTCDNFQEAPAWRREDAQVPEVDLEVVDSLPGFNREAPAVVRMNPTQRDELLPRWLWDASVAPAFEEALKGGSLVKGNKIEAQTGFEQDIAAFPLLTQNLTGRRGETSAWRKPYDVEAAQQGLSSVLEFEPGKIWVEPEIWVQRAGATTQFHYDYDPFNLVFQVHGSRRFHLLPPQSGLLQYAPEAAVKDYGTRWAYQMFYNSSVGELVADLKPGDMLYVPNGWPHRVTYTGDSIGRALRSWTQCQALSLFIGRRLCTLSTSMGGRLCFDDENYRENGGLRILEEVRPAN
mmetsp:Transcript_86924/g.153697  ORF Transcript_86924/g.153697 Transcript_86924/m.153697 type:complete len:379 (+) Transcript_86924:45-1181(+)